MPNVDRDLTGCRIVWTTGLDDDPPQTGRVRSDLRGRPTADVLTGKPVPQTSVLVDRDDGRLLTVPAWWIEEVTDDG